MSARFPWLHRDQRGKSERASLPLRDGARVRWLAILGDRGKRVSGAPGLAVNRPGARVRGRRARAAGTALNWVKSFVQNGVVCTVSAMPVSQALPQTWYAPPGPTEPERAAVPERTLALRR